MADCPICNATLYESSPIIKFFRSDGGKLFCKQCGWKTTYLELREKGGLDAIKVGNIHEHVNRGNNSNKSSGTKSKSDSNDGRRQSEVRSQGEKPQRGRRQSETRSDYSGGRRKGNGRGHGKGRGVNRGNTREQKRRAGSRSGNKRHNNRRGSRNKR